MDIKTKAFWAVILLLVGASAGFLISSMNKKLGGAYNPQNFGYSVYFTTTTDHELLPGNSAPIRVDEYGQIILAN